MELILEFFGELVVELLCAAFGWMLVGTWRGLRQQVQLPGNVADPVVLGFIGRATQGEVLLRADS